MSGRVLVVGATGILRPAVDELTARGCVVVAVARGAGELAGTTGVEPVAVDVTRHAALRDALAVHAPLDAALVYAPFADPDMTRTIAAAVNGPVVVVLTSSAADPATVGDAAPDPAQLPAPGTVLLLGWRRDAGVSRWHTPDEVSAAAIEVLDSDRPAQLGAVRPWNERVRA